MKQKTIFINFEGFLLEQIEQIFWEVESPALRKLRCRRKTFYCNEVAVLFK